MTIEELYGMMMTDDEVLEGLSQAVKAGTVSEWAAGYGVEATEEELASYARSVAGEGTQLTDEQLDAVAGGGDYFTDYEQPTRSALSFGQSKDCNL